MNINKTEIPTNRNFGLVFSIFFLFLFLFFYKFQNELYYSLLIISFVFFILGIFNSRFLLPFNKLWIGLGNILGGIFSPVVMFLIFFLIITPTGLIMKIIKRNLMNVEYDKHIDSYWIKNESDKINFKDQF